MSEAELKAKWHRLLFGVRRSTRYHLRRRQYFDRLAAVTNFLVIVSGGAVISLASAGDGTRNMATIMFGAIIGVLSALDLVIGFSVKARDYHDLARDFMGLERQMLAKVDKLAVDDLVSANARRLEIEENEPPILRALDALCHNELCQAEGYDKEEWAKVTWWQQQMSNLWPFANETFPKFKDLNKRKKDHGDEGGSSSGKAENSTGTPPASVSTASV